MTLDPKAITILLADDDPDDQILCKKALMEIGLGNNLVCVQDGEELLKYLHRGETYANEADSPRPDLILLDLNMPRKDGREALKEIKADSALKRIPIVVFSTSKAETDISATYDLGVNSFITKPLTFNGLVEVMRALSNYWFSIVELPRNLDQKPTSRLL